LLAAALSARAGYVLRSVAMNVNKVPGGAGERLYEEFKRRIKTQCLP